MNEDYVIYRGWFVYSQPGAQFKPSQLGEIC